MNPPASEESLIVRILEMPPDERAEFLRRTYVENPGLRDRLRQIAQAVSSLENESRTAPLPSSDAERARVMELAFTHQEVAGASIGHYKLIQEIGEGGFGVVWMAEQQEPIRRRVAMKVIKSGMDSREVIARFETERQALALMDHPGIARVFDAGTTQSGRPYFVMELVRGTPITRYCDDSRMPVEARLRLFISVCRAVQHAHQKGIIHRDLKPSNIIVTQHDGVAAAKIIDFGIAKATGSELRERTLFTRFHAFIGTPAYTSPEQMEMSGLDVDTRSDIYSLGVLLYELLAGRPPFDPAQLLKSSLEEMRRTIREDEPPLPSQSVCALQDGQRAAVGAVRSATQEALANALRGDLDWIVMHCLEKDRTRRYETASGLAADVCRYLDNEPVTARPASTAYRIGKFVRRNRLAVVAAAAVVISLMTGLVVASVALVRERAALIRESTMRLEADANAAQARTEAAKNDQVARFMKDMLSGAGPSAALGRDTAMLRDIVDATARRLDSELKDHPEVATDLLETLALVYRDLGFYQEAEERTRKVVAFKRGRYGNGSAELADSLVKHGVVLRHLNRIKEAEAALGEALAILRALHGHADATVADTLFELARLYTMDRGPGESERMMLEVLDIRREEFGSNHILVAATLDGLGTSASLDTRVAEAAERYSEALAMYRQLLGNDHPTVALTLYNLASSLRNEGPSPRATAHFREALFIQGKVLDPDHPDLVVTLLDYMADIPASEADEETTEFLREFVARQRRAMPRVPANRAPALILLATLLDRPERDPAGAALLRREAEDLIEGSLADGPRIDLGIASAMGRFGWCKFLNGNVAEGLRMCEAGVRSLHGGTEETRGTLTAGYLILGWMQNGMGRHGDAVASFKESLLILRARWPANHGLLGLAVSGLGMAHRLTGHNAEAQQVLREALDVANRDRAPNAGTPRWLPAVLCELGRTLNHESSFLEAGECFREAIRLQDGGVRMWSAANVYPRALAESGLGVALAGQGRFGEAEPLLLHALEEMRKEERSTSGYGAVLAIEALDAIVAFYDARGMPEQAARWRSSLE
ncbi:MAG TPA: serine/threonine-protein kinase [Opitutaceae bacterium]|nr:serine/threonine-protein kinase [Opitutaceae bacterium]